VKALERQNPNKASLAAPEINGVRPHADMLLPCGPQATAPKTCTRARSQPVCTRSSHRCRRECHAGKWELIYTTSGSILGTGRPPFLRPIGPIYQFIGAHCCCAERRVGGCCCPHVRLQAAPTRLHAGDRCRTDIMLPRHRCGEPQGSEQGELSFFQPGMHPSAGMLNLVHPRRTWSAQKSHGKLCSTTDVGGSPHAACTVSQTDFVIRRVANRGRRACGDAAVSMLSVLELWRLLSQVFADLTPQTKSKVAVKFTQFRIFGE